MIGRAPKRAGTLARAGNKLAVNGVSRRLGGMNCYWVGLDDNTGGSPAFPSHTQITAAFTGMREMGVNFARAHTVGISTGTAKSFETTLGTYVDANLDSADYAVYQAKLHGIQLMVPLTDNWNYYHGGLWNFVHWAYQQNPSGLTDVDGSVKDDQNNRQFFQNTAPGMRIRALYKDYIKHWLNHVNPYTGLPYRLDPTIAVIETGNEIYYASQLGTNEWTQDICAYVKSIAPTKLLADGSAASGVAVSSMPGLTAAACDIVGSHYYPADASYNPIAFSTASPHYSNQTTLQQLSQDVTAAKNAGKVFLLGEYPWTRSDAAALYSAVEANADIAGDLPWAYIANTDGGTPEGHGGSFGSDDYPIHRPYADSNEQTYAPAQARHTAALSGVTPSNGAGTDPAAGTNLINSTAVRHASDASLFSVGNGSAATDGSRSQEGGSSVKVTPSAASVYPYIYTALYTNGAPVTVGAQYTGVVSVYPQTSQAGGAPFHFAATLSFFTSSGSYISNTTGADTACPSGSWTKLTITTTIPANAAYAVVQAQASTAMGTGDVFNIDELGIFSGSSSIWAA